MRLLAEARLLGLIAGCLCIGAGEAVVAGSKARPVPERGPPDFSEPASPPLRAAPEPDGEGPGGAADAPEAPLLRTDRRDYLPPGVDLLILAVLVGWLVMMMSRRRREAGLVQPAPRSESSPAERASLRPVSYPSEEYAQDLRRYRSLWIEEFKSLQNAWAKHDLRPVSGIVGPEVRDELERAPAARAGLGFFSASLRPDPASDPSLPQIVIRQADPADNWEEGGKEHVTVHFNGVIRTPGESHGEEFDEYWTFCRDKPDAVADAPWVVVSIRRGTRERSLPRLARRG
jgi:hypothetical protein